MAEALDTFPDRKVSRFKLNMAGAFGTFPCLAGEAGRRERAEIKSKWKWIPDPSDTKALVGKQVRDEK